MILEHSNVAPYSVQKTQESCCSRVTGNLRKIQHMVLTLTIGLLFLGQWHNTCEVTSSTAKRIQEPNFCRNKCKNLATMRQMHQDAVGLCKK